MKKKLYIRLFITRETGNFVKLRLLNRKVTGRLTYDGGCHLKPQFCCSTASGHRWRHWAHCCQSARCYWKTSVHRLNRSFYRFAWISLGKHTWNERLQHAHHSLLKWSHNAMLQNTLMDVKVISNMAPVQLGPNQRQLSTLEIWGHFFLVLWQNNLISRFALLSYLRLSLILCPFFLQT